MGNCHSGLRKRSPPLYGRLALLDEIIVGEGEMVVAEESAIGTQGRWVGRLQHEVARTVDDGPLALGVASPKYEHQS